MALLVIPSLQSRFLQCYLLPAPTGSSSTASATVYESAIPACHFRRLSSASAQARRQHGGRNTKKRKGCLAFRHLSMICITWFCVFALETANSREASATGNRAGGRKKPRGAEHPFASTCFDCLGTTMFRTTARLRLRQLPPLRLLQTHQLNFTFARSLHGNSWDMYSLLVPQATRCKTNTPKPSQHHTGSGHTKEATRNHHLPKPRHISSLSWPVFF